MNKKFNFSFWKYMGKVIEFLIISSPVMLLILFLVNSFADVGIDLFSGVFTYILVIIILALINALDLRRRCIDLIPNGNKTTICYHYFKSEADSQMQIYSADKKNIYFDYADKIRSGLFFMKFYGIAASKNLLIPKVFDNMEELINIINQNKNVK